MPAYNFQERFADPVEQGIKRQTIRKPRKRSTKVGDTLYLYTGQRTKHCRKLGQAVCKEVIPIRIGVLYVVILYPRDNKRRRILSIPEIEQLAKDDGFDSIADMERFFRKRLPFMGEIIKW